VENCKFAQMKPYRYILFTVLVFCIANVIAAPVDNVYIQRQGQLNQGLTDYYLQLQIPPGNPTQPNALAQPEVTGQPLPTVTGDYTIPRGWPQQPYFNPPGGPPGPPAQWQGC
jgi:hypothetical protein